MTTFLPIDALAETLAVGWIVTATGNWNYALLLFAAMYGLAAVVWMVLNPKGTLFEEPGDQCRSSQCWNNVDMVCQGERAVRIRSN